MIIIKLLLIIKLIIIIIIIIIPKHLFCARYYAKCFRFIISFDLSEQ